VRFATTNLDSMKYLIQYCTVFYVVFVNRKNDSAWCSYKSGCRSDDVVQRVHERIAKLTGIPANHSEDFQVLKYEPGQFYRAHHDYIGIQRDRR
jgi:prolyl 4-hydroxylase